MTGARVEVLRRLGDPSDRLRTLVLETPLAGRGTPDDRGSASGAEQLRVCLAVLSRLYETAPARAAAAPRARWRLRGRPDGPVVVGVGPRADALRRGSVGLRVSGAPVLVVGGPLDEMAAGLWRRRVEAGSGVRWHRLWAGFVARNRLPGALDPLATARRWAARTSPSRVHLVLARSGEHVDLAALLAATPARARDRLDAVDTDLLRRLNQVLATRPEAVRRRPYAAGPSEVFAHPWTGEPGVPGPFLGWARERGERLAGALVDSGLPLIGDPRVVVPSDDARARRVPVAATLDRALAVLAVVADEKGDGAWRAR